MGRSYPRSGRAGVAAAAIALIATGAAHGGGLITNVNPPSNLLRPQHERRAYLQYDYGDDVRLFGRHVTTLCVDAAARFRAGLALRRQRQHQGVRVRVAVTARAQR
jgi:hypothetical protein